MENKKQTKRYIFIVFHKLQKPIIIFAFVLSILSFVYSLCFSTDVYPLYYFTSPGFYYVRGSEIYFHVQKFNKQIFELSLAQILICISMFVFFTQKRRKYYLSNYITSILYSAFSIFFAVYILTKIFAFKADYLQIDFAAYKAATEDLGVRYIKSTLYFDLGIVISLLFIISALLVIGNLTVKHIAMKKEIKIFAELKEATNYMPEVQNG